MRIDPGFPYVAPAMPQKEGEDVFDLDLSVFEMPPNAPDRSVQDPSAYCGSKNDDCTGCGCNTCCSSC